MEDDGKKKSLKLRLLLWIASGSFGCGSIFLLALPLLVVVFMVVGILGGGDGSGGGSTCVNIKSADEICQKVTVKGQTMSVDAYVAGVVENEFGGASIETKKAQAIAARSYGLQGAKKDSNGNCIIDNTSEGFQTYNSNPSETSIQAANDTSGMILVDENGNVARSEYSSNSLPASYNSYGDMITMSERNLQIPRSWWASHKTCGDGDLNTVHNSEKDAYGRAVYGCGHGRGMGQIAALYLDMELGYTYDQILEYFYGADSEYHWSLASTKGASSSCTSSNNGNFQSLSSYNKNHDGLKKLNKTLTTLQIQSLELSIESQVDKAGYGTGKAVAAAGQALTYGLEQMGYYLGYYWGGGHASDSTTIGFYSGWGKNIGFAYTDGGNVTGPEYGMDCSGFVSWAIRNACKSSFSAVLAEDFLGYGKHLSSLEDAKPGDVLASTGHVILVIKNNGDGSIIAAEESFSASGLVFKEYSSLGNYKLVDMSNWYKSCNQSRS